MKKISLLAFAVFFQAGIVLADQASSAAISLQPSSEPVQQFVTSDSNATVPVAAPAPPPSANPVPPPPPAETATLSNVAPPPQTTAALGVNASDQVNENVFANGLDIPMFLRCQQSSQAMCKRTGSIADFQDCLKKIKVPACKQFFTFANLTGMGPKDDIDVVKNYPEGGLDLVHLMRFGANYPGVYYSIGKSGEFIDLIFGAQTQKIDIRKDIRYQEVAEKFPNVELFSIIEKLPDAQPNPMGDGLRLVFRFQLLNGCHACERAGYANIAYDFSDTGKLQNLSVVSLDPST